GVSLAGASVLDIGSGLGAVDVLLANTYGAAKVTGVDVEPHLIEHSKARAKAHGCDDRVSFQLIEPGPLPFADASFDAVFTKDAIVHIPDKDALYRDVRRILKPGGVFVGSDWLCGGPETQTDVAERWLDIVHLDFQLKSLETTQAAIESAGFERVRMNDRNDWYRDAVNDELATLSGEKYDGLAERIGADQAAYRLESSRLKKEVIDVGFLRPTHFVAYKPS
ncbi:MAG: class I SAM-dependent methyltransferase, partial [Pseudomonadota bacterium]